MKTLCDILERVRSDAREDVLMVRDAGAAQFRPVAAAELIEQVECCAAALSSLGVGRHDRVGLICSNRPEWHIVDFGCQRLGAVLVPLFATLTKSQVAYAFGDSGCSVAVVEGADQRDKLSSVLEELVDVTAMVAIDPPPEPVAATASPRVLGFSEFMTLGEGHRVATPGPAQPDDVATLIYTSGTTGPPKGVMLSHANLVANAEALLQCEPLQAGDIALSLLPLCHVYERTLDYYYLMAGVPIAYSAPDRISTDFKLARPTVMVGVPRLYQKLRTAVEAQVAASSPFDSRVYDLALRVGMRHARARRGLEPRRLLDRLLYPLVDALVTSKIRAVTGGRMRAMSAGGAALDPALNWWFEAMGWSLAQGYGMTESSPVISTNTLRHNRIGSVGRPLDRAEVRIDEDGEILTRGPCVMKGYWRRPEASAEAVVDGWLRTGDIGRLDADGFLWITDRKKAILVTSTGKNVAPGPLEGALEASPYIAQAIVLGDDQRFVSALLVPHFARLGDWAARRGLSTVPAYLCRSAEVELLIQAEVDRLLAPWARYERVRAFRLVEAPFTVESGHMTPTMKLIRDAVVHDHADLIEAIYAE